MRTQETMVLLHGSGSGAASWGAVRRLLPPRTDVIAPDMLAYGDEAVPTDTWSIAAETHHLRRAVADVGGPIHVVAHSLGAMFGLYLTGALGGRVSRLTLVDPVVVSLLRETDEVPALNEMEAQFQRFMGALPDEQAAARAFVDHWVGCGAGDDASDKARKAVVRTVPKVRLEMIAGRADRTRLVDVVGTPTPFTTVLVGARSLLAPHATARQLVRAWGARLVVVSGAGHMIPATHPQAIVDAVLD